MDKIIKYLSIVFVGVLSIFLIGHFGSIFVKEISIRYSGVIIDAEVVKFIYTMKTSHAVVEFEHEQQMERAEMLHSQPLFNALEIGDKLQIVYYNEVDDYVVIPFMGIIDRDFWFYCFCLLVGWMIWNFMKRQRIEDLERKT